MPSVVGDGFLEGSLVRIARPDSISTREGARLSPGHISKSTLISLQSTDWTVEGETRAKARMHLQSTE